MKTKNELESAEIKNINDTVRAEWEVLSKADWEKITCGFVYDIFSRFIRSKDAW
jgi:translation initiation factor 2B subunit (eIF-2B alpha/beta/delta family)